MPNIMPNTPSFENDVHAHYARELLKRNHKDAQTVPPGVPLPTPRCFGNPPVRFSEEQATAGVPFSKTEKHITTEVPVSKPVGILGAGPGGLYTALILQDLGIPYQILEAQDHVGGRLFTYTFREATGAPYNYYDVGAMRFPDILPMRRLFTLFRYPPLNEGVDKPLSSLLQPYYFASDNAFMSFNGKTYRQKDIPAPALDPFLSQEVIKDVQAPGSPIAYILAGVKNITDDVIGPFATRLLEDVEHGGTSGWEYMKKFDAYSTRSYMNLRYEPSLNLPPGPLTTDVINWCETFDKSTGWYDRSLSETVLEAVAFGWKPPGFDPPTEWYCLKGGAVQIAVSMANYITSQQPNAIMFNSRVTTISAVDDSSGGMEVTVNGAIQYQYSHVISTLPLPVLRSVDMHKAGLLPMQSNALRELTYGPAIKVGMQFKTAWWTTAIDNRTGLPLGIVGGQSFTDGMLRTIVYPSFGNVVDAKTTTLIASYCWTDDASRFGALIDKDNTFLVNLVVRELADIHGLDEQFIRDQLIGTMAWSWPHDPYTMGAYAFFGPGKFEDLYTSLNTPAANGYLHFAGEALSIRHAWVEGALDSAWRAVGEMLLMPGFEQYQEKFIKNWGNNPEWIKTGSKEDKTGTEGANVFTQGESLLYEHIALTQPALNVDPPKE